MNTSTDSNKAVDDNMNVDINKKTEDVEKAVRSEIVKEKLEDEANENVNKIKDVEKSSEPIGWIK